MQKDFIAVLYVVYRVVGFVHGFIRLDGGGGKGRDAKFRLSASRGSELQALCLQRVPRHNCSDRHIITVSKPSFFKGLILGFLLQPETGFPDLIQRPT